MKKIFLLIGLIVYLFLVFPYSLTMASEEAKYDVVHKADLYEVRFYSERLIVESINDGDGGTFRKLFNYISGANSASEKIEMTTPVTEIKKGNMALMQFYLPSRFNEKTIPIPSNSDVKISIVKEGYFGVIKYSGRSSDKNFIKYTKILHEKLLEDRIIIIGLPIKATYNSPFTLPLLRRNEVMFNIKWKN